MATIYMTKQATHAIAEHRQAGAEIVVTPQMVEAGIAALPFSPWDCPQEAVSSVFRAMLSVLVDPEEEPHNPQRPHPFLSGPLDQAKALN